MILVAILVFGLLLCLWAAMSDMTTLTIPNRLNLAIAGFGLAAILAAWPGPELALQHLAIAAACLIVGFGLFSFGLIGGGDAKMIPAVAIWLGPAAMLPFLAAMAVAGGVLAVFLLVMRSSVSPQRIPAAVRRPFVAGEGVPYAVAIAAGAIFAAPRVDWIAAALNPVMV
jgi:prepilin peptidase CpaA